MSRLRFDTLYIDSEIDLREYKDEIIDWVKVNYEAEEVFDTSDLEEWAMDNGFVKESDGE